MKPSTPANKEEDSGQEEHGSESAYYSEQKSDLSKISQEQEQTLPMLSPRDMLSKWGSSTRSWTKVQMQGVAIGHAVDLASLEGYDQLYRELEELFSIKGDLHTHDKWEISFTDHEGDMMPVGDDPWDEFCDMPKKIYICSSQEVKKMSPGNKWPASSLEGDGTGLSLESSGN